MSTVVQMGPRDLRCMSGLLRQGDWFFLPRPWMQVNGGYILHREPIRRGGGKPHICEQLYHTEGDDVFVHGDVQHPDHETIVLPYWHKVVMNTETRAKAMEDLAFLD